MPNARLPLGFHNVAVGWTCVLVGLLGGMVMGFWSFDGPAAPPPGFEDYAATSRRLMRLAHIACIALGLMNVLIGRTLREITPTGIATLASRCMNLGNTLLPLTLLIAAFVPIVKYAMALPATCVLVAVVILVAHSWRRPDHTEKGSHDESIRIREGHRQVV